MPYDVPMPLSFRRSDHAPRVEMMPLIDVIFLLLTFFIYAMVLIEQFDFLPIQLAAVAAGGQAPQGEVFTLTIDAEAQLYLNREPVTLTELGEQFNTIAQQPEQPHILIALGRESGRDRGPILLEVIGLVQSAKLKNFTIVSPRSSGE